MDAKKYADRKAAVERVCGSVNNWSPDRGDQLFNLMQQILFRSPLEYPFLWVPKEVEEMVDHLEGSTRYSPEEGECFEKITNHSWFRPHFGWDWEGNLMFRG